MTFLLLSTGYVLDRVLEAAEQLKSKGRSCDCCGCKISSLVRIRPKLLKLSKKQRRLFTVEDHNVNGGLGSYISNLACEYSPVKISKIGLRTFGESGPAKELADHYGFTPENILKIAMEN